MTWPQDCRENEFKEKFSYIKRASHDSFYHYIKRPQRWKSFDISIHQTRSLKRGSLKPTQLSSYKGVGMCFHSFHISPCKNNFYKWKYLMIKNSEISWFQFKCSKFLSAFLHVLMPLNVTGSVSTLSMERKEVWNYK